jgi:restriction system protein
MGDAVWSVKGGRNGEREDRLLEHGVVGGGLGGVPDLTGVASKEELAHLYRAAYPEAKASTVSSHVGQLWSLANRMQDGELVVLPLKTTGTIAVGRIAGPYQYRTDLGEDLRHCRPVAWIATDVARDPSGTADSYGSGTSSPATPRH